MTELLTSAQMRALEQGAITGGTVTGLELMERAGAGVVAAVLEEWPAFPMRTGHAVVLCGPGNNGGDGFVVARLLRQRGWTVWTFHYGDPDRLPPDAKVNHDRWVAMGPVMRVQALDQIAPQVEAALNAAAGPVGPILVVDALFGIGLTRPVPAFDVIGNAASNARFRDSGGEIATVAVDVPSGLCADSGRVLGKTEGRRPLAADLTVTFHRGKPGHYLADGPMICGKLKVVDLGLPVTAPVRSRPIRLTGAGDIGPGAAGKRWGHKFDHGHALVLSGPSGKSGAARLAARAALRVGAGLVTVAAPESAMAECAAQLTAVMLRRADDTAALSNLLLDDRITAVCLGPGLGLGTATRDLVLTALVMARDGEGGRGLVLDADALTQFSYVVGGRPEELFDQTRRAGGCVLTPHAGEFARLFPDLSERLSAPVSEDLPFSKLDATREAAARAGCVVLFKGADTVVAAPDGQVAISAAVYDRAAPWLATAGSGDVLAGFIAGLLARRFTPFRAAAIAAHLHVDAALSFGPGLIAEDLPEELPKVLRRMGV